MRFSRRSDQDTGDSRGSERATDDSVEGEEGELDFSGSVFRRDDVFDDEEQHDDGDEGDEPRIVKAWLEIGDCCEHRGTDEVREAAEPEGALIAESGGNAFQVFRAVDSQILQRIDDVKTRNPGENETGEEPEGGLRNEGLRVDGQRCGEG